MYYYMMLTLTYDFLIASVSEITGTQAHWLQWGGRQNVRTQLALCEHKLQSNVACGVVNIIMST